MTAWIRAIAVGLTVRDRHVLAEEYRPAGHPRFVRALGGGIEFGERAADALRREWREELALEIDGVELLAVTENIFEMLGRPGHEIVHVYEVTCAALEHWSIGERRRNLDADTEVGWFDLDTLATEGPPFYPDGMIEIAGKLAPR